MAASDVKIIGSWGSPYVMRPCIALNLKNLDYEFFQEPFGSKSELLLKSNPIHKKMPVMIHNDKPICESIIIVQYVDEAFTSSSDSPILPSDPYDRAIARFWAAYIDDKWFGFFRGTIVAKTDEEKKEAVEGVTAGLVLFEETFENLSKGKGFFGGETIGLVDIALGSFLPWLKVSEKLSGTTYIDETTMPGLYGWVERFCANAAVKDLMPETEKLLEYAKKRFSLK